MLTCREITELVTDYVEGRMTLVDRFRFWMHIGMCSVCRRYVSEMETAIAVLGHTPAEPPSEETMTALRQRFRSWRQQ